MTSEEALLRQVTGGGRLLEASDAVEGGCYRSRISGVAEAIQPYVRTTPVLEVDPADCGIEAGRLLLKLEQHQHTGSFKVRGAFANLLLRPGAKDGVVAASGGNHGVAVAYAARRLGIQATVFVPSVASPAKVRLIRELGATLVVAGDLYSDALLASERHIVSEGGLPVHAFDQLETILGQGTVGMEIDKAVPDADSVIVAVGGGGLIAGIAAWYGGRTCVVGVEPELAPTLTEALAAGRPVDAAAGGVAADSLAPRRVGEIAFPIVERHVRQVELVADAEIARAQQLLWDACRIVAEPGGATALAALVSGQYVPRKAETVLVVVCGANTTAVDFARR